MLLRMRRLFLFLIAPLTATILLNSCSNTGGRSSFGPTFGPPNMGGPTVEERQAQIANEPRGNFFYGRRYYVKHTRFWGYVRKPGQSANEAKLVVMNESKKLQPDRLPEDGPVGHRFGFDQNYVYRLYGYFTGDTVYEVNSNQFLPEFMLTGYKVIDKNPGWLFSPKDHYNPHSITLVKGR